MKTKKTSKLCSLLNVLGTLNLWGGLIGGPVIVLAFGQREVPYLTIPGTYSVSNPLGWAAAIMAVVGGVQLYAVFKSLARILACIEGRMKR